MCKVIFNYRQVNFKFLYKSVELQQNERDCAEHFSRKGLSKLTCTEQMFVQLVILQELADQCHTRQLFPAAYYACHQKLFYFHKNCIWYYQHLQQLGFALVGLGEYLGPGFKIRSAALKPSMKSHLCRNFSFYFSFKSIRDILQYLGCNFSQNPSVIKYTFMHQCLILPETSRQFVPKIHLTAVKKRV